MNNPSTAFQFFYDMRKIILFAPLIRAVDLGLLASFTIDLLVGSVITSVSTLGFGAAMALSPNGEIEERSTYASLLACSYGNS